jgi:23S rRNA pseudouridine2605 synthase
MRIRLNRYISLSGIASRRKAEFLILEGKVKVNGKVVRELSFRVDAERDVVEVEGRLIRPQRKRYIILNKPCCYLTALEDKEKRTIRELIKNVPERVYPVGRLDYNTEGLLILTNDGELANRILHPRYKIQKVYLALVSGIVDKGKLRAISEGATIEDGFAKPDALKLLKTYREGRSLIEIVFHEGRKHLVKRYLAHFGHKVLRLKRTAIGPIRLGDLPMGRWRDLREQELKRLFRAVGLRYSYGNSA